MTNSSWDDIFRDGIRLEKIIRFCETMILKKDIDEQLKLSYIDRMIKATHQKVEIAKIRTDLTALIRELKKNNVATPRSTLNGEVKNFFKN